MVELIVWDQDNHDVAQSRSGQPLGRARAQHALPDPALAGELHGRFYDLVAEKSEGSTRIVLSPTALVVLLSARIWRGFTGLEPSEEAPDENAVDRRLLGRINGVEARIDPLDGGAHALIYKGAELTVLEVRNLRFI
jgi:hypothetical protein